MIDNSALCKAVQAKVSMEQNMGLIVFAHCSIC